ncbi:MAG: HAD family phosphatase [Candidatus Micrarchaeota archaeon]|nr:HAD family phosphatase [Candidatus Micrarchaeota archaeon]
MIKGIIFDIGGVIVRWDNRTYYSYLGRVSGIPANKVGKIVDGISVRHGFESGKMTVSGFEGLLAKRFGISKRKVKWFHYYKTKMRVDRRVIAVARELHKSHVTAYLSNIDKMRHSYTRHVMDTKVFDYAFASFAIGCIKPNIRIYRYAVRKMGMKPDELLFIDNMRENVAGARKAGLRSFQFTGIANLRRRLQRMGLLGSKYK